MSLYRARLGLVPFNASLQTKAWRTAYAAGKVNSAGSVAGNWNAAQMNGLCARADEADFRFSNSSSLFSSPAQS